MKAPLSTAITVTALLFAMSLGLLLNSAGAAEERVVRSTDIPFGWQPIGTATETAAIKLMGLIEGPAQSVTVRGNYAYLAAGEAGLRIIDVSDPAAPSQVGRQDTPGEAINVDVAGSYAYLATKEAGLRVIDISDVTAPAEVGRYDTPGWAFAVHVTGNYAYVADGRRLENGDWVGESRLRVFDVSTPSLPTEVGTLQTSGVALDVHVRDDHAYLADYNAGLRVIDISDPTMPTEASTQDTEGRAVSVHVTERHAHVGTARLPHYFPFGVPKGYLQIFDIRDPVNPTKFSDYAVAGGVSDIHVSGNYAHIIQQGYRYIETGAGEPAGLQMVDITDPTAPNSVGFYPIQDEPLNIHVVGQYAYLTSLSLADGRGRLRILGLRLVPVSTTIPPDGGSLTSSVDQTTYTFGLDTFTDTVTITHTGRLAHNVPATAPTPSSPRRRLIDIDHFFEATAVYGDTGQPAIPTQPYTILVQYADTEKGPAIEDTLALYRWNGQQWVTETTSMIDVENNIITAMPDHFGLWGVLGETERMVLPLILRK